MTILFPHAKLRGITKILDREEVQDDEEIKDENAQRNDVDHVKEIAIKIADEYLKCVWKAEGKDLGDRNWNRDSEHWTGDPRKESKVIV